MEELNGKFELQIIFEENNEIINNSMLFNDTSYFGSNTDIPFQTVDDTVPENAQSKLTDLNNVELETETHEMEAIDDDSYLPINLGSDIPSNETLVDINDNLDLGFEILPFDCDNQCLIPELVVDTNLQVDMNTEPMKCWNYDQEIHLNESVNTKETANNDLLNLNAKCLLSSWRERIKSNLLYCKQCAVSFQNLPELRSHNDSVHKSPNQSKVKNIRELSMTLMSKLNVKKLAGTRKSVKSSKRKVVNDGSFLSKNRVKTKPGDIENEDLDVVKSRRPCIKRKGNPINKSNESLAKKGSIRTNPMVSITDVTITMKDKNGRKHKIHPADSGKLKTFRLKSN